MHNNTLQQWQHSHEYNGDNRANERRTRNVVILTAVMMLAEIIAGSIFGSMALTADGWHMGTHAAALGMALLAYWYARKQSNNPRYTFGTGKISVLSGFSSAIVLQLVAILMVVEAVQRLINPARIQYLEAIIVAVIGLVVNLVSAKILDTGHTHSHGGHAHEEHMHSDQNLRAAYLHVLADALTSVLAIIALLLGQFFGWAWMDALAGIVGALVISRWAIGLLRDTGRILLDGRGDDALVERIRTAIEADADNRLSDLHVWKVGDQASAAIISLVTHNPRPVEHYRSLLDDIHELSHITIEVIQCEDEGCFPEGTPNTI